MAERQTTTLHANCIVLHDAGILIRGVSGSGKSSLSRALLSAAHDRNWFARLVSDDRTRITVMGNRLIAQPVNTIKGLLEIRGLGIVQVPVQEAVVLRLVIDLVENGARMPDTSDMETKILSVTLPRFIQIRGETIIDYVFSYLSGQAQ